MNHEFTVVRSDSVTFLLSFTLFHPDLSLAQCLPPLFSSHSRGCFFFQRKEEKFCGWNYSIEGRKEEKERKIKRRKRKRSKRETDLKSWYLSPTSSSTTCYINSQTCSIILPPFSFDPHSFSSSYPLSPLYLLSLRVFLNRQNERK